MSTTPEEKGTAPKKVGFSGLFRKTTRDEEDYPTWSKSSLGILSDKQTAEVPGTVQLLASKRNRPLGMRSVPPRTSHSTIPVGFPENVAHHPGRSESRPTSRPTSRPASQRRPSSRASSTYRDQPHDANHDKKKTADGAIILEPQPDDSANDPLNWESWRRDIALLCLGFYCMVGGGTTPLLAAGFTDVGREFSVDTATVALTTGLYMMGMGLGSVIASPVAILYGKRPVYLASAVLFVATSLWSGFSPSFESLLAARVFQGVAVSPVECLPSATIAEIFFLHERAYRIGIYTLLLLGGKNLVPLVSAVIIGGLGWRWVFYIIAIIVAFGGVLLFLFVPETFWDRTPTRTRSRAPSLIRRISWRPGMSRRTSSASYGVAHPSAAHGAEPLESASGPDHHMSTNEDEGAENTHRGPNNGGQHHVGFKDADSMLDKEETASPSSTDSSSVLERADLPQNQQAPPAPTGPRSEPEPPTNTVDNSSIPPPLANLDLENMAASRFEAPPKSQVYTQDLRQRPPKTFVQQLKPYHGRLNDDDFFKVMIRPFVLFTYPAVLWSSIIYACSVGWLIVISETMAEIYRDPDVYGFDALQTGLIYISPFVGGILGTGVAGHVSDIIVRAMSRRNGGVYEPEFRLVMAIPVLITTCIGLMGFGWSASQKDHWMIPTVFFGVVSFGCSLGSTTAITFVVDSYRQYAGEALVTLNFTKNICHGLVFSLFIGHWLHEDGPKMVYIWIGIIQLILVLLTIPMYIYGKRARMWTVRKNLMEKF